MQKMVEEQGMASTLLDWEHPDPQQWILIHHPGTTISLTQPNDAQRMAWLEERLRLVQQQFLAVQNHPYVRFGLRIKFCLVWLAYERRRILRWVHSLFRST